MIKAIETEYAGCLFRSRLEARWAVFMDTLGVRWVYEREGFELPSGSYLPDFYLPDGAPHYPGGAWLEIKGERATWEERQLLWELHAGTNCPTFVLEGDIPRSPTCSHGEQDALMAFLPRPFESTWTMDSNCLFHGDITRALASARSARFEYGQKGASSRIAS